MSANNQSFTTDTPTDQTISNPTINTSSSSSSSSSSSTIEIPDNNIPTYREGISDDVILQQEQDIRNDIALHQPLVSPITDIMELFSEYEDNPVFVPKLVELGEQYSSVRKVRGDGNCYYRSILVNLGEQFVKGKVRYPYPSSTTSTASSATTTVISPIQLIYNQFISKLEISSDKLISLGYNDSTTPDFFDALIEYVKGFGQINATIDTHVIQPLNDENNGIGLFGLYGLRLLTSLELLTNEELYLPFILGLSTAPTVELFCRMEVETPASDVDMVQVMALGNSLNLQIKIAYLDASPGNLQIVTLPEEIHPPSPLCLHVLYRPGHYDVIYPRI